MKLHRGQLIDQSEWAPRGELCSRLPSLLRRAAFEISLILRVAGAIAWGDAVKCNSVLDAVIASEECGHRRPALFDYPPIGHEQFNPDPADIEDAWRS